MDELLRTVAVCKELRGRYNEIALDGAARPVSMNILTKVVEEYSGKKVAVKLVKWPSNYIRGCIKVWADFADIIASYDLNLCWRRYVSCKELMHLAIDSIDSHTKDIVKLVQKVYSKPLSNGAIEYRDVQSEILAVIAAAEMLFPFEERQTEKDKVLRGEQKFIDIASFYKIPEAYVEKILSDEWMRALGDIHRKLDGIA